MFTKLVRDGKATFNPEKDTVPFMRAILEHTDPLDLLYELTRVRF